MRQFSQVCNIIYIEIIYCVFAYRVVTKANDAYIFIALNWDTIIKEKYPKIMHARNKFVHYQETPVSVI